MKQIKYLVLSLAFLARLGSGAPAFLTIVEDSFSGVAGNFTGIWHITNFATSSFPSSATQVAHSGIVTIDATKTSSTDLNWIFTDVLNTQNFSIIVQPGSTMSSTSTSIGGFDYTYNFYGVNPGESNLQFTVAPSAAVPEPSSLVLAFLGVVGIGAPALMRRRARRHN